jgi:DNA polymerase-3 subunit delta
VRLRPDQLDNQPAGPLASGYLVSGDEPLLVDEALGWLRARARAAGISDRDSVAVDKGFDWDAAFAGLANLSLFSSGTLLELRLTGSGPGTAGAAAIRDRVAAAGSGNVVAVVTPTLDRRARESAWVQAVAERGVWIDVIAPTVEALPRWLAARLKRASLAADDDAIALLAACVEGNLLAAQQEIDKLALLHAAGSRLGLAEVQAAAADGARFDVFQLADAALAGDAGRAIRVLGGLRDEGVAPPLILWSLVREILTLLHAAGRSGRGQSVADAVAAAGVWRSRADLVIGALRRQPPGGLTRLLGMARAADQVVKGARRGDPWLALHELTLSLAGAAPPVAELA